MLLSPAVTTARAKPGLRPLVSSLRMRTGLSAIPNCLLSNLHTSLRIQGSWGSSQVIALTQLLQENTMFCCFLSPNWTLNLNYSARGMCFCSVSNAFIHSWYSWHNTHLEAHALEHPLDLLQLRCVGANLVTLPVGDRGERCTTHDYVSSENVLSVITRQLFKSSEKVSLKSAEK